MGGQRVLVVGGGPAGLMAAEAAASAGAAVTVFEHMRSVGRKFLLAGRSGLNLTHCEPLSQLLARYSPADARLVAALDAFPPEALRAWCHGLGEPTFIGSSGRVFPTSIRATPLLRAWLGRLTDLEVVFAAGHRWTGWDGPNHLTFSTREGPVSAGFDAAILAMGGGSWPTTGSDAAWVPLLRSRGVAVAPIEAANCGLEVAWTDTFRTKFEGRPVKNVALTFGERTVRGDMVITAAGIEGGPVYALAADVRAATEHVVMIDLRPDVGVEQLTERLARPRNGATVANHLRKAANLAPEAIGLLRDALASAHMLALLEPTLPEHHQLLAEFMKHMPLAITGLRPIARAISSSGGVPFTELDENFMLQRIPGTFVAGEMLAWDAPTGGYLLQGCFSTGVAAGTGALRYLGLPHTPIDTQGA